MMKIVVVGVLALWGGLGGATRVKATDGGDATTAYDPLSVASGWQAETIDLVVQDATRGREIPLRVYLPATDGANETEVAGTDGDEIAAKRPAGVILFSHGLGGSREGNPYLGRHWSGRGYVVVFLQHPGSDESVWKDVPALRRLPAMRRAASLENTLLRLRDVPAVLDQLERWQDSADSPLHGRLDLTRIGMSGHSFGAVTTQGVSGQRPGQGGVSFSDPRIKAALIMSPSVPMNRLAGDGPRQAFGAVAIPWMLMTGTKDVAAVGGATLESRLAVYPALPPGSKYELVLAGAEHEAFGDRDLPVRQGRRNPNHHRVILGLSTAFWDTHLRGDPAAQSWLDGSGPATLIEPDDRWQKK